MRLLTAVLLIGFAATAAARLPAGFAELNREALQASQAKDYPRMQAALQAMLQQRPGYPRLLYKVAAAKSRAGDAAGAVAVLDRLARMGLTFAPQDDADFADLRATPAFRTVVERLQRNGRPQGEAQEAFSAGTPTFIPEGLAYDASSGAFFLSSVHERRVLRIDAQAKSQPFVPPGRDGLWSALGLHLDARSRLLWAATAAFPEMRDYDGVVAGRSGLFAFDLADGSLRHKFLLPADGREHALGDLILATDGSLYTTDSAAGMLYRVDRKDGRYQPMTAKAALISPQGLALSSDGRRLYLADYAQGLLAYDIDSGKLQTLTVPDDICVYGIDGLYRHGKDLIAVQNGVSPQRILRIRLNAEGTAVEQAEVLASALPEFEEPTLGTIVGDSFYFVANSQWNRFDQGHRLPVDSSLQIPRVLKIDLGG